MCFVGVGSTVLDTGTNRHLGKRLEVLASRLRPGYTTDIARNVLWEIAWWFGKSLRKCSEVLVAKSGPKTQPI